jgi:cytochrome d ubiquinol oxidase subunit I
LYLVAISTPLGFLAVEAGWTVTEVGRQPWIIYNIMRTADSVTPVPGQIFHLFVFIIIYLILTVVAFWLMKRQVQVLNESQKTPGT